MAITLLYDHPPLQGQQDVALATRMEIHEGGHRTVPVHASMVGWISQKMAGRWEI